MERPQGPVWVLLVLAAFVLYGCTLGAVGEPEIPATPTPPAIEESTSTPDSPTLDQPPTRTAFPTSDPGPATAQPIVTQPGGGGTGGGGTGGGSVPDLTPLPTPTRDGGIAPLGQRSATATPQPEPTPQPGAVTATPTETFPDLDTFRDRYEVAASAGQTLNVDFIVSMVEPGAGRVYILVFDPNGERVSELIIPESRTGGFGVVVAVTGTYTILATSEDLRGTYSVTFGLEG